jgi:hypothetical protein
MKKTAFHAGNGRAFVHGIDLHKSYPQLSERLGMITVFCKLLRGRVKQVNGVDTLKKQLVVVGIRPESLQSPEPREGIVHPTLGVELDNL